MNYGTKKDNKYFGEYSEQGFIYKNYEAFNTKAHEICYIAECGFDGKESLTEDEAVEEIDKGGADTFESLFQQVDEHLCFIFGENKITPEFAVNCCKYIFETCDWQCISTLLNETDFEEDLLEYVCNLAKQRPDWNNEWSEDCLFFFLKEKLDNEDKRNWDDIIDEFVSLPDE